MDDAIDFRTVGLSELAGQVRRGEVAARELAQLALDRIAERDPAVNAFVAVDGERALEQAAAVDQIVAAGGDPGPLAGVPLAVKDLEDAAGYRTTRGSARLAASPPAVHDSPHVARLRAAGCVVVGKTNTPELAYSTHTGNDLFGHTRNPWHLDHSPGGSSGGSAAALAAGMVPLATGSDGGGSIRVPSACCGLSGMKTSLGRVPAGGPEPPGWLDLSTPGPMAWRIADVIAALEVAVGPDPSDLRALPRPEASWTAVLDEARVPARVAWSPTLGYATADAEVLAACERAVSVLEGLGAEIVELDAVFDGDPVTSFQRIVGACMLRSAEALGGTAPRGDQPGLGPFVAAAAEAARSTTAAELVDAIDECHRMNLRLVELFRGVRLLVTPATAAAAPPIDLGGAAMVDGRPVANWVPFTYPFNMTRSPAATVCAGLSASGLPVGVQLVGPQHGDLVVLRSAAALEAALGFDLMPPG